MRNVFFILSVIVSGICLLIIYVINPSNISANIMFGKIVHGILFLSIVLALILGIFRKNNPRDQ